MIIDLVFTTQVEKIVPKTTLPMTINNIGKINGQFLESCVQFDARRRLYLYSHLQASQSCSMHEKNYSLGWHMLTSLIIPGLRWPGMVEN